MSPKMWMVRAGVGGFLAEDFEKQQVVGIGWHGIGDLSTVSDREAIKALLRETYPEDRPGKVNVDAGQIGRFVLEFEEGDRVMTYDPQTRKYSVGRIAGPYEYRSRLLGNDDSLYPHIRKVTWDGTVDRDVLSTATKNEIGAIMTIFRLSTAAAEEFERRLTGEVATSPEPSREADEELETIRQDTIERAHEFIKDRVSRLDWDEMQELVAGLLRAMGYKTRVSPRGADRGRDVIASPDGLGLEQPRIIVEVKHRREPMSADVVRAFIGGLRSGDRGLYVSTGGFSREAKYEADRASVPVTLVTLDDLVELVVEYYETMDSDTKALIPLVRLYWPAS